MPDFTCPDCGKIIYHENQTTLDIQIGVHKKFCTKKPGDVKSHMHRAPYETEPIDEARALDNSGNPILKR
ncbi:MAG: hypothetical protein ACREAF_03230 [Nitrosopumilaceae archaeon]